MGCGICVDECPQDVFAIEGGIDDLHAMDAQDHRPCFAR
ncbi:4Fe-4S binding domain protein [Slackia sp. CM382]|nr:4Fe-4S binding domain protein [Slackia sp. CM382]